MVNPSLAQRAERLVVVAVLLEGSGLQAKAIVAHAQVGETVEAEGVLERWRQIDPQLTQLLAH